MQKASRVAIGRGGLPLLLLATAFVLVAVALLMVTATAKGQMADRLHRWLERLLGRWLGAWLERNALRFQRTDQSLAIFFKHPLGLVLPVLLYMAGWMVRSLETLLFLYLLGVNAPLSATMALETTIILVRVLVVPVPGGLGVQDLGYVLFMRAFAVPDAITIGTTLALLKRGKEIVWTMVGLMIFVSARRRGARAPASPA